MKINAATSSSIPEAKSGAAVRDPVAEVSAPPAQGAAFAPQTADLRLIIEEDKATGAFVYKTLDRRTGEIVKQLPREEVLRLKDDAEYVPGDVTETRS